MVQAEPQGARPLVSVILPTWNSAALLPRALESLAVQTFRDFEVIVSDGGSSDGSADIAAQFAGRVPGLRIDSRRDTGVYDAINRGVRLSAGVWLLVLGSDDTIHAPDTLARVAPLLRTAGNVEMAYGDVRMMAANLCGVPPGGRYAGAVSLGWLLGANLCQQSIFYRRELYEALGGFNERYRLHADWDFNLRAAFRADALWMDVVVADYAATGMTATAEDAVFRAEMPELVRAEFLRRPTDRRLWPFQRGLRKTARQMRKQGRWKGWATHWLSYARLLLARPGAR